MTNLFIVLLWLSATLITQIKENRVFNNGTYWSFTVSSQNKIHSGTQHVKRISSITHL